MLLKNSISTILSQALEKFKNDSMVLASLDNLVIGISQFYYKYNECGVFTQSIKSFKNQKNYLFNVPECVLKKDSAVQDCFIYLSIVLDSFKVLISEIHKLNIGDAFIPEINTLHERYLELEKTLYEKFKSGERSNIKRFNPDVINDEYLIKKELNNLYDRYNKVKSNTGLVGNKLHSYKYSIPLLNGDFAISFTKSDEDKYEFKKIYSVDFHYINPTLHVDMQKNHEDHIGNFTLVRVILDDIYNSFEGVLSDYLKVKI